MDWGYVFAYWRIADREGRRANEISAQLLKLAEAEWTVCEPKRGRGLWEGSAWGTPAALQRAGIRVPRNFFLAHKAFVKKLKTLATHDRHRRLRRRLQLDFAGVLREDPEDVAALRELGYVPEQLVFRGFVLVGWGVPKGIVWIGLTRRSAAWQGTPEQRAVELFLPKRKLPMPETIMDGVVPGSRLPFVFQRSWRRDVARSHLAALGFHEVPGSRTDWVRADRRYGSGPKVDEFLLIEPSAAELSDVRLQQLQGEVKPLWVEDYDAVMHVVTHFPWLWKGDRQPMSQWDTPGYAVLPAHPRWSDLHKLQLILATCHVLETPLNDSLLASLWPEAKDVDELLSVLDGLAISSNTLAPLRSFLLIEQSDFFAHPTLTSLLRAVTDWNIVGGSVPSLRRCALVCREHDPGLARRALQRLYELGEGEKP